MIVKFAGKNYYKLIVMRHEKLIPGVLRTVIAVYN